MIKYYMYVQIIKAKKYNGVRRNRAIIVYNRYRDGFGYIGHKLVDHNSYRGDEAVANEILHEKYGYRWLPRREGFELQRKDVKVIPLPTGLPDDSLHLMEE